MSEEKTEEKAPVKRLFPSRLYCKGIFVGFRRGLRNQTSSMSLVKIEGVLNRKESAFYLGKKCVYMYKAKRKRKVKKTNKMTNIRCIWGKIVKSHGNSGIVRAKFRKNLPPQAMGRRIRVMLYPSKI